MANAKIAYGRTSSGKSIPIKVDSTGRPIISLGGTVYPEVDNFSSLPPAALHTGDIYIVLNGEGIYVINRKSAGLYNSDGVNWTRLGNIPAYFLDGNFKINNTSDNTKGLVADASTQVTGTTGTIAIKSGEVGGSQYNGGVSTGEDLSLQANAIDAIKFLIKGSNNTFEFHDGDICVFNGSGDEVLRYDITLDRFTFNTVDTVFSHLVGSEAIQIVSGVGFAILQSLNTNLTVRATGNNLLLTANNISLQGLTYPNADGTEGQYLTTDGAGLLSFIDLPVFGTEYQSEIDTSQSDTSSITPVNKLSLITGVVPAGNYKISVSFEWARDTITNSFLSQVTIDGGGVMLLTEESKDTSNWHPVSFFVTDFVLTNASHTINLDFWGEVIGNTSSIRNARIEVFRVS